ncbi:MAG: hypothetical protein ACUVR2_08905 [Anaerolineae bacterium]
MEQTRAWRGPQSTPEQTRAWRRIMTADCGPPGAEWSKLCLAWTTVHAEANSRLSRDYDGGLWSAWSGMEQTRAWRGIMAADWGPPGTGASVKFYGARVLKKHSEATMMPF